MRRERYLTEFRANPAPSKTEMLIYAGTPVYRYDWYSGQEYTLQLSLDPAAVDMTRLLNGAPITVDHFRATQATVGSIENARLTPQGLIAEANRFTEGDLAAETWAKVDAGVLRALSVEAFIQEQEDVTPKGQKLKAFMATKWQPQAVSIVPVGADPAAQFLSDDFQDFWVPEQYRRPIDLGESEPPANNRQVLHLLLLRRNA